MDEPIGDVVAVVPERALRVVEKVTRIRPDAVVEKTWTGLALLEEFVAGVKAGTITPDKLMIFWLEVTRDDRWTTRKWQAGCDRSDEIALCEMAKMKIMEDWRA